MTTVRSLLIGTVATLVILGGSYAWAQPGLVSAYARSASVTTTACGHASATTGAAVVIDDGEVLVAAHVVIGATDLIVTHNEVDYPARLSRIDTRTDLALLEAAGVVAPGAIRLARPVSGTSVHLVGDGPSGSVEANILRMLDIGIEEVRSTARSRRLGFELDRRVALGDSGAAVVDGQGRLVGVVFGRSTLREDRSFAVHVDEIALLLEGEGQRFGCNPSRDRMELAVPQSVVVLTVA